MRGRMKNKHGGKKLHAGRGTVGKQAVTGMRERGTGKIKAEPVSNTNADTLKGFVRKGTKTCTIVCTDEHSGYNGLDLLGFAHKTINHSAKEFVNGTSHANGIESVWALLKRGYYGIFYHFQRKACATLC